MTIDLSLLPQLAEIYKKLMSGYHISEQDFSQWTELDAQEQAYTDLFQALGSQLKRDSRGYFYFESDEATATMGKISRLFALTIYALVEFFSDQGKDPLRALFDIEIDHEILSNILQQQYHLFEQLEIFSATDLKREVGNRMVRHGFARVQGENFKLLPPIYRYLDALMDVDLVQAEQEAADV